MRQKIFIAIIAIACILIAFKMVKESIRDNDRNCETKHLSIKGIVTNVSQNQEHRVTTTDHPQPFKLSVSDYASNHGFPEDYIDLKVGDSLIKKADTNFVAQKRGNKVAVLELNCID